MTLAGRTGSALPAAVPEPVRDVTGKLLRPGETLLPADLRGCTRYVVDLLPVLIRSYTPRGQISA